MPFFAPYLASEGLLRAKGYSDSPPPLRPPSEAKYDERLSKNSLAEDAPRSESAGNLFLFAVV